MVKNRITEKKQYFVERRQRINWEFIYRRRAITHCHLINEGKQLKYEQNQMNFAFIQLDWSKRKKNARKQFEKIRIRREYCSGDQEILSTYGGFPITEIRMKKIEL